jgi:hypothetical protein
MARAAPEFRPSGSEISRFGPIHAVKTALTL